MQAPSRVVLVSRIHLLVRKNIGYARKNSSKSKASQLGNIRRCLTELCFGQRSVVPVQRRRAKVNAERDSFLKAIENGMGCGRESLNATLST